MDKVRIVVVEWEVRFGRFILKVFIFFRNVGGIIFFFEKKF